MSLTRCLISALALTALAVFALAVDDAPEPRHEDSGKPGLTLITIQAHNLTPKETFDEISRQSNVAA